MYHADRHTDHLTMDHTDDRSMDLMRENTVKLTEVSFERIRTAGIAELYDLSIIAGIQDDERLVHCEDLRERLILVKRKMEGSSHAWKHLFESVREETQVKRDSLLELMKAVEATFKTCPLDSLSEILRKEGHVQSQHLLEDLSKRMRNLQERRSLVVIAGETNGGKSTFLNLLLGEDILPTDILHCTFSVCKIVYSETYSLKTLDYNNQVEHFPCGSQDEVKTILRSKLAQQEMKERLHGSPIKEMTLGLPADILKSGVTLVDTPGIGEDEHMDNVTMNFVKSSHASAFIYIIKSDTAGGIQEDRLLSFLRAIKDRYSEDSDMEAFDPRAAMFVCHRWDNIEEHHRDKVKQNALQKLEYVWPGFQPAQTYFFSTTDTMKHFPVDPEFVTDSFMTLLKGMQQLFDRASHNAIKHQYLWLKYMLPPASHYLKSMITHCIHSNDELEVYFRSVVIKQNKLMASSTENSRKLQSELDVLSQGLKVIIVQDLNFDTISVLSEINNCDEIITVCSSDNFLFDKANRRQLDEMIIRCLLKYVDEHVHDRKIVTDLESQVLSAIQEHLGLFKCQISLIKHVLQHGGSFPLTPSHSRTSLEVDEFSSQLGASTTSMASNHSSLDPFRDDATLDTTKLAMQVKNLLLKRKDGKSGSSVNSKHEFQESLLSKVKNKIRHGILHKMEPAVYVEERIRKVARDIRENAEIMDSIVCGYTEWIQRCVSYATNSIPKFIEVNNKLMEEIREHRGNFQRDKDLLRHVMEQLEPCRHSLRGYGLLYMDDINAEMLAFTVGQRNSSVYLPRDLVADYRPNDDSGFLGSGSKQRQVQKIARCLWAKIQGATIKINNEAERVIVKTYIYDMDERAMLSEIATLRCLDYTNLASFLGMTRIKATGSTRCQTSATDNIIEKVSAFIFKGDLVSANVYSKRKMTNMQLFVPDLVHSLLQGLNYIHREGLVHMELNLDTVMVERLTGNVKLCQMCKPREARFPTSLTTITRTCVCLSPNVLQGHEYESTDDIYAFGLLLWELLCPDQPPYREQRVWPLKRFMEECHPSNMLHDDLMKLDVSEQVLEVLKGTLLVARRTICMPITTVQSLLADISDEPAVKKLRSRQEYRAIRRTSPVFQSDLLAKSQLSNEPSPPRPPRKTDKPKSYDKQKSFSDIQEQDIQNEKPLKADDKPMFPLKYKRRQTEPAIFNIHTDSPLLKPKKKLNIFLDAILGRGSTKTLAGDEVHEPEDSLSRYLNNSRRASPPSQDCTDERLHASGRGQDCTDERLHASGRGQDCTDERLNASGRGQNFTDGRLHASDRGHDYTAKRLYASGRGDDSSSHLKPAMGSQNARKDMTLNVKSQPRRFSLQDQSLFGPRKVTLKRDDSFDVPVLLSQKFSKTVVNSLSVYDITSGNSLSSSQPDLSLSGGRSPLPPSKSSSRSSTPDIDQKHQPFVFMTNNSNLRSSAPKDASPDSKQPRRSLPETITRRLGLGLGSGRSLEDISPRSKDNLPITSASARHVPRQAAHFQPLHNRHSPVRHVLRRSLQDISSVSHAIEPILEDRVETSNHGRLSRPGHANQLQTNKSSQKFEHRRMSPPEMFRQSLKLASSFRARDTLEEENMGSSSSLASTCSSSSLSASSGCCIDVSGTGEHPDDPVSHTGLTASSTPSYNNIAALGDSLRDDHVAVPSTLELTNGDTSQLGSSFLTTRMAPPPPEINFSKLTFGHYPSSDEEESPYD